MVYGVKSGGEIQEGEGCDRPFISITVKIIMNIKEALSVE